MKRFVALSLVIMLVVTAMIYSPVAVFSESMYIKKIVSVVYDDSGSMEGDKWAYANYAQQAFCGMLNSGDQLYITYMSHSQAIPNYTPKKVDLSSAGIQNAVHSIRQHVDSGTTPFDAVEVAYNKLLNVKDSNANTQYWLVVITDGAFDECNSMSGDAKKSFLNKHFGDYIKNTMPNGTRPQVTFLAIGDDVVSPDADENNGIYTYSAKNADEIIDAMSAMADKVSGRTRLPAADVKQLDDTTLQVSSSVPLLNIAVVSQKATAQITKAAYSNATEIPISRKVSLSYPGYADLVGQTYLIGDSQNVIDAGTYNIVFDQKVDSDKVVFLFEPALEARLTITANGKEISDYSALDKLSEGDTVSASCKIYEMGNDTEINPSLLPPGTKFEISIVEDGKIVTQSTDAKMFLPDYVLKNTETEISANVVIEGFNPIGYSAKFTPLKFGSGDAFSITSDFISTERSVRLNEISANKDMGICFTIYKDGQPITDLNMIKALDPVITVSPSGNSGEVTYSDEGKIIFKPNAASPPSTGMERYDVEVVCTIGGNKSDTETYTVLISDYQVIPLGNVQPIKKTKFFENREGLSFCITKDGIQLDKAQIENDISVQLNEQYSEFKTDISIAEDGTVTVIPYSDVQHRLNFWTWWTNWWYYFGLKSDDLCVTLNHTWCSGDSVMDVTGESLMYQVLNVYLPLIIELAALVLLIMWIILVVTKPRYLESAKLYVGEIRYNKDSCTHTLRNFSYVRLSKFNKVKKGNGRLKFKRDADIVSANGIKIRAERGGRIFCNMPFPWYRGLIEPVDTDLVRLKTPSDLAEYFNNHRKLEINEFATTETIDGVHERNLAPSGARRARYIIVPDVGVGEAIIDGRSVIKSGKIFIYING